MLNLTMSNFDSTIAKGRVLVYFYTDWCGYCKILSPVLEELSKKYIGSVTFSKIDAEEEDEIADRFGVRSFPTVILLEDGKEIARELGAHPLEVFEKMIGEK